MLGYMTCVAVTLVLTNIAPSHSTEPYEKLFVNEIASLPTLQFIRGRNNSEGMNNVLSQDAHRFEFLSDTEERICELKCREFQYEISQQGLSNKLDTVDIPKAQCFMPIDMGISGKHRVEIKEFPHMVSLGWFEKHLKFIHRCGGSLISEKWILTAAHCTANFLKKRGVARFGITRLSIIDSGMIIGIVEIVRHPEYMNPTLYADIALMRLARPVVFSDAIKPACLYSKFDDVPKMAWATGWGTFDFGDEQVEDSLHAVKLEITDTLPCALAYNQSIEIPQGIVPSMLCAADLQGDWKGDTCKGDSGGPLQFFNKENCIHVIVGITCLGKLCGIPNYPGVYTRVSYYLDWIESIVWPEAYPLYPSS